MDWTCSTEPQMVSGGVNLEKRMFSALLALALGIVWTFFLRCSAPNCWFRVDIEGSEGSKKTVGVDSLSILFNHRSFQKPDPFPLGF